MPNDPQWMPVALRQSPLPAEANPVQPDTAQIGDNNVAHHLDLLSCSTSDGRCCANAIKNANQTDWGQARLACADVGIDPGNPAFGQCVFDLYYSLWNEQNASEN